MLNYFEAQKVNTKEYFLQLSCENKGALENLVRAVWIPRYIGYIFSFPLHIAATCCIFQHRPRRRRERRRRRQICRGFSWGTSSFRRESSISDVYVYLLNFVHGFIFICQNISARLSPILSESPSHSSWIVLDWPK